MKKILVLFSLAIALMGQSVGTNTALLTAPPPSGVFQSFVANTGVTGQTSYCYFVVAVYPVGMSQPSGPVCTSIANATLDSSNYNTISWNSPSSAVTGWWVLRSTTSGFPSTGTFAVNSSVIAAGTLTKTDQSNTLNAFTMSSSSFASANLSINNRDYPAPVVQLIDKNGNLLAGNPFAFAQTDNTGALLNGVYSVEGNVTVAQINAGITVLAASTGRTVKVIAFEFQAIGGAFGACTLVQIVDTTGTPVVSVGVPIADLTQNTIVGSGGANVVFTTFSWQGGLTASQGLALNKTGSSCTTVTSMNYRIMYKLNS